MPARVAAAPVVHRFTRDEYYRMGEAGLFTDERVELLDGEIITMAPQNPPHAGITSRIAYALMRLLGSTVSLRVQLPIVLNDWSEPEPDIAVCLPDPDDYEREHPRADQVLLVIEVAEASLFYDRSRKVAAYAGSGIPEYWIVNLVDRRIEALSAPDPATRRYQTEKHAVAGDILQLPGGVLLAAADVLPRY
ncbi:MAG TPA: Uma2 family endonuclease [Candidatus Binatia bacterium]|jgi:Uma2 family endonuclease|nr:Uma2 family endonuclease [Candidatus Binatia bacterium]